MCRKVLFVPQKFFKCLEMPTPASPKKVFFGTMEPHRGDGFFIGTSAFFLVGESKVRR